MQSKSQEIRELAVNAVMSKSLTPQKAAEVAGVSVPTRVFPVNIKNVNSLLWTTSITGDEGDWGKSFPPRKIKITNIIGKRSNLLKRKVI